MKHQIDRDILTTGMALGLILYHVVPEAPKLRSMRRDSNQRWQMRRKLYESFDSLPKSPSCEMTFEWKILPSISCGRRPKTFNKEPRMRLSWIMVFSCSSIYFLNARMKSRLIYRSITIGKTVSGTAKYFKVLPTHLNGGIGS